MLVSKTQPSWSVMHQAATGSEWFIVLGRMELFVERSHSVDDDNRGRRKLHCQLGQLYKSLWLAHVGLNVTSFMISLHESEETGIFTQCSTRMTVTSLYSKPLWLNKIPEWGNRGETFCFTISHFSVLSYSLRNTSDRPIDHIFILWGNLQFHYVWFSL